MISIRKDNLEKKVKKKYIKFIIDLLESYLNYLLILNT